MPELIPPGGRPPEGLVNKAKEDLGRMEDDDVIGSDIVVDESEGKDRNDKESKKYY